MARALSPTLTTLLFLATLAARATPAPMDVVFDLDWTLLYSISEQQAKFEPESVIRIPGDTTVYRLTDHSLEVIAALHRDPEFRVSYLSGGERARNHAVVTEIYRRLNRSFRGASEPAFKPYLIGSREDLLALAPEKKELRFSERYKKDLKAFFNKYAAEPPLDLSRAVLIDDTKNFAVWSQKKNHFWLQKTYEDVLDFNRWVRVSTGKPAYYPEDQKSWWLERAKLIWAYEAILRARETTRKTGVPFSEALGAQTEARETLTLAGFKRLGFGKVPMGVRPRSSCLKRFTGGILQASP